jgi:predicted short-subunit dehydrogenase-like oxidoreductase (DUF2520 family)
MLASVAGKPGIAIVGAGNLAQALAPALRRAGYRISEVISRAERESRRRAQALARQLHTKATDHQHASLDADIIWLCMTDDAIAETAQRFARRSAWRGKTVLHSSGALSSDELAPLRLRGAAVGSVHPMMTFVRNAGTGMKGIAFALEGDAKAVRYGRRIAEDLGGIPFRISKESKVLYHAMGSFSSPMVVIVLALGELIAAMAGIPRQKIPAAMRPILLKTIDNYMKNGSAGAFSGPINRGDIDTVRKHLTNLQKVPAARAAYVALARAAAEMLPVRKKEELLQLLSETMHASTTPR